MGEKSRYSDGSGFFRACLRNNNAAKTSTTALSPKTMYGRAVRADAIPSQGPGSWDPDAGFADADVFSKADFSSPADKIRPYGASK